MEPMQTILSNLLWTIILKLPKWIRMKFFNVEKWVGEDFIIEPKAEKIEAEKKERWKAHPGFPFDRVLIRIPWDNRSRCDVELKELSLRVFVNHAPLKNIIWSEKEKKTGIVISHHLEREIDVYNAENFVFRQNECYV